MKNSIQPREKFTLAPDFISEIHDLEPEAFKNAVLDRIKRYDQCVENGKKGADFGHLGGRPRKIDTINNDYQNPLKTPLTEDFCENPADALKKLALGYTIPQTMQVGNRMVKVKHVPPNLRALEKYRELTENNAYADKLMFMTDKELLEETRNIVKELEEDMLA